MPIRNPIIKSQLVAFGNFFSLDGKDEAENFEKYSIFSVANGRDGLGLSPEDFHLEGSDFGLDGVGVTVGGEMATSVEELKALRRINDAEFYFFQSKTSEGIDYGDLSKFLDAVESFFTSDQKYEAEKLNDAREMRAYIFDNASKLTSNPKLKIYYVVTGKGEVSSHALALVGKTKAALEGLSLFSEVDVEFVGAAQLQQYYRRATDAATASFQFKNRITLPSISNVSEAYIGYISTDELLRIITINPDEPIAGQRINRKLFFDNVRDFDPESEINNQMADSLITQSQAFVYRNNGITVVARQGRPTGDNFRIEDYKL